MKSKFLLLSFVLLFAGICVIQAQSVGINTVPAASAALDVSSTSKGILIPRMSTSQRTTGISSPAAGLMVYDNTLNSFYYYNGSAWAAVGGGNSSTPVFSGSGLIASSNTNGNGTFHPNFTGGAVGTATESDAHRLITASANTATLTAAATGTLSSSYTMSLRRGTLVSGSYVYSDIGSTITISGTTPQVLTVTGLSLVAGETIAVKIVGTAAFNAAGQQRTIYYTLTVQ